MILLLFLLYLKSNNTTETIIMRSISTKRIEQIARNINAMDVYYQYSDDMRVWRFWNNLKKKLENILENLTDTDKNLVTSLCEAEKRKYFNLV